MAIATATAIALALAAASAGANYYNTQKTISRQDDQAADAIRSQSKIQQKADGQVNAEVEKLKASRSEDYRRKALDSYMATLTAHKPKLLEGLSPNYGSSAFQADAAQHAGEVQGYANDSAGMMARMDAPGDQRLNEGFSYGQLATDIGLDARESKGQSFIDELRMRAIRRSPGLDALSAFLGGAAASGVGAYGFGGATKAAASVGPGTAATINTGANLANYA